jgi:hypothetical protein
MDVQAQLIAKLRIRHDSFPLFHSESKGTVRSSRFPKIPFPGLHFCYSLLLLISAALASTRIIFPSPRLLQNQLSEFITIYAQRGKGKWNGRTLGFSYWVPCLCRETKFASTHWIILVPTLAEDVQVCHKQRQSESNILFWKQKPAF